MLDTVLEKSQKSGSDQRFSSCNIFLFIYLFFCYISSIRQYKYVSPTQLVFI